MKIICEDKVYVQKRDIFNLYQSDTPVPVSIYLKVFKDEYIVFDDKTKYEFIEFDEDEEIEFFRNINWMIDYNDIKDLPLEEIAKMAEEVVNKHNKLAKKYNSMPLNKRVRNNEILRQIDLLDYKIDSYTNFILFREKKIKYDLPEDVSYPKDYKKDFDTKKLLKSLIKKAKK